MIPDENVCSITEILIHTLISIHKNHSLRGYTFERQMLDNFSHLGRYSGNDFRFPDIASYTCRFRLIFGRIFSVVSFRVDIIFIHSY